MYRHIRKSPKQSETCKWADVNVAQGRGLLATGRQWTYAVAVNVVPGDSDMDVVGEYIMVDRAEESSVDIASKVRASHHDVDYIGILSIGRDGGWVWMVETSNGRGETYAVSNDNANLRAMLTLRAAHLLHDCKQYGFDHFGSI